MLLKLFLFSLAATNGGFNKRSRRREEADFCNKSSSASSRRRLRRLGRFLNPPFLRVGFSPTPGEAHGLNKGLLSGVKMVQCTLSAHATPKAVSLDAQDAKPMSRM